MVYDCIQICSSLNPWPREYGWFGEPNDQLKERPGCWSACMTKRGDFSAIVHLAHLPTLSWLLQVPYFLTIYVFFLFSFTVQRRTSQSMKQLILLN